MEGWRQPGSRRYLPARSGSRGASRRYRGRRSAADTGLVLTLHQGPARHADARDDPNPHCHPGRCPDTRDALPPPGARSRLAAGGERVAGSGKPRSHEHATRSALVRSPDGHPCDRCGIPWAPGVSAPVPGRLRRSRFHQRVPAAGDADRACGQRHGATDQRDRGRAGLQAAVQFHDLYRGQRRQPCDPRIVGHASGLQWRADRVQCRRRPLSRLAGQQHRRPRRGLRRLLAPGTTPGRHWRRCLEARAWVPDTAGISGGGEPANRVARTGDALVWRIREP